MVHIALLGKLRSVISVRSFILNDMLAAQPYGHVRGMCEVLLHSVLDELCLQSC